MWPLLMEQALNNVFIYIHVCNILSLISTRGTYTVFFDSETLSCLGINNLLLINNKVVIATHNEKSLLRTLF